MSVAERELNKVAAEITEVIAKKLRSNVEQYGEILPEIKEMTAVRKRILVWLLVGQKLGIEWEKLVKLAEIFSYIYLAHEIHRQIGEEEYHGERQRTQYQVLVGDFMYGNFFLELAKAGLLQYLSSLARLILDLNEAALIFSEEDKYKDERIFMGQSLAILGDLADVPKDTLQELITFGEKIGEFLCNIEDEGFDGLIKLKEFINKSDILS
ncbi:isoprenoid biosynthesis enzyme family protein [Carboxydothermus ferrireducens]|uniref:Polyprenyl synthetase n=1 Tax=Carboxydothermus ferrireducens DSM 11255 TaxID=1119529 RepID=A0ABX2RC17_9THEO|nr:hypothetical protein [Carboxydothermus ferrireducens]NYE58560.1 hypothetical protein [Carboxydothermus ferrireducens DSM 11255]